MTNRAPLWLLWTLLASHALRYQNATTSACPPVASTRSVQCRVLILTCCVPAVWDALVVKGDVGGEVWEYQYIDVKEAIGY